MAAIGPYSEKAPSSDEDSQCSIAIDRKLCGSIAHVVCRNEVGYAQKSSVLDWSTIMERGRVQDVRSGDKVIIAADMNRVSNSYSPELEPAYSVGKEKQKFYV